MKTTSHSSSTSQHNTSQFNIDTHALWSDLQKIRRQKSLVHNITNYVVMDITANALLAIGASPVMAHAQEEVAEMVALAQAIVINIGTLSREWVNSMVTAAKTAATHHKPWVLDPVGVGATKFRTETAHKILTTAIPTVIRGNASEIAVLCGQAVQTKGVDSTIHSAHASHLAQRLAQKYKTIIAMSGEVDYVCDANHMISLHNGHPWMSHVTGMGCSASAITGAFLAVNPDYLYATAHAQALMGVAGLIAQTQSTGLGEFKIKFIDVLSTVTLDQIEETLIQNDQ